MAFHDRPYYGGPQRGGGFGGGSMGGGGFRIPTPRRGSYTFWLLIINFAVFFLDAFFSRTQSGESFLKTWGNFNFEQGIAGFQVWRVISYQYLHAGFGHIFFNMMVIFFFGPYVEQFLGSKRFLGYYTLCGISGVALYMILFGLGQAVDDPSTVPFLIDGTINDTLIGASACTFGILVAMLRIAPHQQVLVFLVVPVKIWIIVTVALIYETYSVMVGSPNVGGSAAHLGGAILGWLLICRPHLLNFTERVSVDDVKDRINERVAEQKHKRTVARDAEIDRIL
ncbi:MAG: rhomboid family intramembrane serine protease, partial [Desulfobacterales bacterium]|nr:rhomboid family intramembrane serine protease [Desulfobacterales bacterium]